MKKKYLIIIFVIFGISLNNNLKSQSSTGFIVGANFSQLTGNLDVDNETNTTPNEQYDSKVSRIGGSAGIFWDMPLKWETSFEFGAIFSQQGNVFKSQYYGINEKNGKAALITYSEKNNIDYLLVPLNWKQLWGNLYTKAGFYGEYKLQSESTYNILYEYRDAQDTVSAVFNSFTANLKPYDVGINLALGYTTVMSDQFDFFMDFSYKRGLIPVHKSYDPQKVMRNSIFNISIGVILRGAERRYGKGMKR